MKVLGLNVIMMLAVTGGAQPLWAHEGTDHQEGKTESSSIFDNAPLKNEILEALRTSQRRIFKPALIEPEDYVRVRKESTSEFVTGPGNWSGVYNWDLIAIHATLLPTGKVLLWDATPDDFDDSISIDSPLYSLEKTRVRVWDPDPLTRGQVPEIKDYDKVDLFCAGFSHLWDGRVLFSGGDDGKHGHAVHSNSAINHSTIYNPFSGEWTETQEFMVQDRWYPGVVSLPNGEVLSFGGTNVENGITPEKSPNTYAEVFEFDETWRTLSNVTPPFGNNTTGEYQWAQVKPNGDVGVFGPHRRRYSIETDGQGALNKDESFGSMYRGYGSYALYEDGKILISGGAEWPRAATQSAAIVTLADDNGTDDSARATTPMHYPRRQHNLTILADGSVLATGGIKGFEPQVDGNVANQIKQTEIWNPITETWTVGASMNVSRQYHSIAILLQDGSVLTGGTGYCPKCLKPGRVGDGYSDQYNYEVYEPPYLLDTAGNRLGDDARPSNLQGPKAANYNTQIPVTFDAQQAGIKKAHFIKLGAVTHSSNQGQRLVKADFTANGNSLLIDTPKNRNLAPPGWYMLFIVDNNDRPSEGHMIRIGQPLLSEGKPIRDTILHAGEWNYYEVNPQGRTTLRVNGRGGQALAIKEGTYPTDVDIVGIVSAGGAEFVGSGQGPYFIGVKGTLNSSYDINHFFYGTGSGLTWPTDNSGPGGVQLPNDGEWYQILNQSGYVDVWQGSGDGTVVPLPTGTYDLVNFHGDPRQNGIVVVAGTAPIIEPTLPQPTPTEPTPAGVVGVLLPEDGKWYQILNQNGYVDVWQGSGDGTIVPLPAGTYDLVNFHGDPRQNGIVVVAGTAPIIEPTLPQPTPTPTPTPTQPTPAGVVGVVLPEDGKWYQILNQNGYVDVWQGLGDGSVVPLPAGTYDLVNFHGDPRQNGIVVAD